MSLWAHTCRCMHMLRAKVWLESAKSLRFPHLDAAFLLTPLIYVAGRIVKMPEKARGPE